MGAVLLLGAISCLSMVILLIFIITKPVSRQQHYPVDGRGRSMLITGCNSGFGLHLARWLDQRGYVVFGGCLFPDRDGAQSLSTQSSSNLKVLKLDVRCDADVERVKVEALQNLPEKGEFSTL